MERAEERENLPGTTTFPANKTTCCMLANPTDPENKRVMNNHSGTEILPAASPAPNPCPAVGKSKSIQHCPWALRDSEGPITQSPAYKLMNPRFINLMNQAGKVQQDTAAATLAELQLSGGSATSCSYVLPSPHPCREHPRRHRKDVHQRANTAKMLMKELLLLLLRHWGWCLQMAQEKKSK